MIITYIRNATDFSEEIAECPVCHKLTTVAPHTTFTKTVRFTCDCGYWLRYELGESTSRRGMARFCGNGGSSGAL